MKTNELSTCFCTVDVDACREFYTRHFSARAIFDCGWYVNLRIGENGPSIQFMQPAMPLEDHPWGDRGFSVIDPIGNSVYVYSDREPSDEFKQYYRG